MIAENKLHAEPRLHFANREIKIHVYTKRDEFVQRVQAVPLIVVNCLFIYLFFLIFIFNCKVLTYNTYLQTMYDTYATNRTILYLQKKKLIYNVRYLRY